MNPTASLSRIRNGEDLNNWSECYYNNPQPDLLPSAVEFLVNQGDLRDFDVFNLANQPFNVTKNLKVYPAVCLISQVFKRHSDKIWAWMKEFKSLPETPLRGLIEAVWMSNTAEGKKVLNKFKASTLKVADFAAEVLARPSMDLETYIPTTPACFDLLWSAFSITENTQYVGNIIDGIPLIKQKAHLSLQEQLVYILSIHWSVKAHLNNHPQLADFVANHCRNSPFKKDHDFNKLIADMQAFKVTGKIVEL